MLAMVGQKLRFAAMQNPNIRFIDLAAQQQAIRAELETALKQVLDHGGYLHGKEVGQLEQALAERTQTHHAIACASGTDALQIVLMSQNLQREDAVIVPAFTFVATAEAVVLAGGTPVFADIDPATFNLTPATIENACNKAKEQGLRPRGIIPVDLFGLPADHDAIGAYATQHDMFVLDDMAQAFGAELRGKPLGGHGLAATTSFYPAKPLGCYGDGGAIFTNNDDLAATLRSIRQHGEQNRYENLRIGLTGRMDTMQAAVLLTKLTVFDAELEQRRSIAAAYSESLSPVLQTPSLVEPKQAWALYTVRTASQSERDELRQHCQDNGIPNQIYYPIPLNKQVAYRDFPSAPTPVAEACAATVLSLPFHPYMRDNEIAYVCATILCFFDKRS